MLNSLTIFGDACKNDFFGLKPWFEYLNLNGNCEIVSFNLLPGGGQSSDVPLILLAIVDDLLRIAGLVAVGFVFYGAFKYVGSQGNPEAAFNAQSTIINALLGLAVAVIAVATVSFIGNKLQ